MAEQHPQVTIPDTEVRRLASSLSGYEYHISIALPAGYVDTDKTYPALYILDPHLTFGMSTELTRLLAFGQELPQLICIGIGFSGPERDIKSYQVRDYVPKAQADDPRSRRCRKLPALHP